MTKPSKKSIAMFDHARSEEYLPQLIVQYGGKDLLEMIEETQEIDEAELIEQGKLYDIVFWHTGHKVDKNDPDDYKDRLFDTLCKNSSPGTIRVQFSEHGYLDDSPGTDSNGVTILRIVRPASGGLFPNDWNNILAVLLDPLRLEELLQKKSDTSVLRYFYRHQPIPEILTALAVLCEGYLVSWLVAIRAGVDLSCSDASLEKEINCQLVGDLNRFIDVLGLERAADRLRQVQRPGWWRIFGDVSMPVLDERIRLELCFLGRNQVPEAITQLMKAATGELAEDVESHVVWDAYRAIGEALRQ